MLIIDIEAVCALDLVVGAGLLHFEAGGVEFFETIQALPRGARLIEDISCIRKP
jgi:hypothetical protein